jgi:hypothetical protein
MANTERPSGLDRCLRYAARVLAVLWAIWWTFFIWATVASEGFTTQGLLVAVTLSAVFLGSALVAWLWERPGSLLLLVEGLIVLIGYSHIAGDLPQSTVVLVIVTFALPPLLAAVFLTMCRRG